MSMSDSEVDELRSPSPDSQTQQQSLHASTSSAAHNRGKQQRRPRSSDSSGSSASSASSEDDGFAASAAEDTVKYIAEQAENAAWYALNGNKKKKKPAPRAKPVDEIALRMKLCALLDPKQDLMTKEWADKVVQRSKLAASKKEKRSRLEENNILPHGHPAALQHLDAVSIIPPASSYATPSLPRSPSPAQQVQQPRGRILPAPTRAGLNGKVLSDSEEEMLGPTIRKAQVPAKPPPPPPAGSDTEEEMLGPPRTALASTSTKQAQSTANNDSDEEMLSFPSSTFAASSLSIAANIVRPRPAFVTTPEQDRAGPLVLDAARDIKVPASINRFLREYQRQGIQFLYNAYRDGRGAILGDDMGLGKTVQVAAFLAAIMKKNGGSSDERRRANDINSCRWKTGESANTTWPTALILVPASLLDNWARELETWGYFEYGVFSSGRRSSTISSFQRSFLDIVLCTHEYASGHIEELKDLAWSCIFADEAHNFKNPRSATTQAMNLFECKRRYAISGTIMPNRSEEMWTILDWTNPATFANLTTWKHLVAMPLKLGLRSNATEEELETSRFIARCLTRDLLPRYMIRRTKALVATDLPPKYEKIVFCPLTDVQLDAYRRLLADEEVVAMKEADLPCRCGEVDEDDLPYKFKNCCGRGVLSPLLSTLFLLTCLANHAALFFPSTDDQFHPKIEIRQRYLKQVEFCKRLFPRDWKNKQCNRNTGLDERLCGKWLALRKLLDIWKQDGESKVLIFSRNLRLLGWISEWISQKDYKFLRLDGSTDPGVRQSLVEEFNRDPSIFCFLISTLAGGVGLNLTGANKVVVFDPSWSPADDSQAIDRAYRIGQTRPVTVYRLIGAGTIEELVYGRQVYKTQAANVNYGNRLATGGNKDGQIGADDDEMPSTPRGRRLFEGVDGAGQHMGELFGIVNMLTYREDGLMNQLDDDGVADADPDAAGDGGEMEEIARGMGEGMQIGGEDVRRALIVGAEESEANGGSQQEGVTGEVKRRASGSGSGKARRGRGSASASPDDEREAEGLRQAGVRTHNHARFVEPSSDGDGDDEGAPQPKKTKISRPRSQKKKPAPQPEPQRGRSQWPPPRRASGQQLQPQQAMQTSAAVASTSAQA